MKIFEEGRICAIPQNPIYQFISIGLAFFMPLFFILGFHAKVYTVAHAHAQRPKIRKLSRVFSLSGSKSHANVYKKADGYLDSENSCATYCEENCGSSNVSGARASDSTSSASGCQNGKVKGKGRDLDVTNIVLNTCVDESLVPSKEEAAPSSPESTSAMLLSSPDDQQSGPDARRDDPDDVFQPPEEWQEMQLVIEARSLAGRGNEPGISGSADHQKTLGCDVDDGPSSVATHSRLLDARGRQEEQSKASKLTRFADDPTRKSVSSTKSSERKHKDKKRGSVDRTTKTVLCLVLCFVVCWLPLFITLLVDCLYSYLVPSNVLIAFTWLGYVNSGLNPVLYYRFNAAIRYAIRCFLRLNASSSEY